MNDFERIIKRLKYDKDKIEEHNKNNQINIYLANNLEMDLDDAINLFETETNTITRLNKMYACGILADIMSQANYMITLSDGSQKLCVDTDIIDKIMDELKTDIDKENIEIDKDIDIEDR